MISLVLAASSTAAAGAAPARFLYVSPRGKDKSKCTTMKAPCRTITGALARARKGDTIQVARGSYHEDVVITKDVAVVTTAGATVNASGLVNGFDVYNTITQNVSNGNGTKDGGGAGILLAGGGPGTAVYDNTVKGNTANGNGLGGPPSTPTPRTSI